MYLYKIYAISQNTLNIHIDVSVVSVWGVVDVVRVKTTLSWNENEQKTKDGWRAWEYAFICVQLWMWGIERERTVVLQKANMQNDRSLRTKNDYHSKREYSVYLK